MNKKKKVFIYLSTADAHLTYSTHTDFISCSFIPNTLTVFSLFFFRLLTYVLVTLRMVRILKSDTTLGASATPFYVLHSKL